MIVVRTLTSVPVDSSRASRIFVSVVSPMMIVLRKSCEGRRVKRRGGGGGGTCSEERRKWREQRAKKGVEET
jgi:hypothetical protein